ncbi:MAG TPA: serine/threonine-protein kinase [Myxococcaceae bacterium]|nr:serine/threonine-protein kinase [Myxococcaceae bacterium]
MERQTPDPADDEARTIPARSTGPRDRPAKRTLEKGTALGRYVILERLGAGGMSEVYAAYDPQLDRRVALKLLRPDVVAAMAGDEGRARVLREAQALARLSHRNVVAVHDVGTEDGEIFIAMEYVEGVTARRWLHEQERSWKEILSVFDQAARGLAAAHDAGLVHRDVKPDNILVTPSGRVVVLDFGLARGAGGPDRAAPSDSSPPSKREALADAPVVPSGGLDTPLTRVGDLMGTPRYMSPEQLTAAAIDGRSDQFSFCISLYEALYGERPFPGEHVPELLGQIERFKMPQRGPLSKVPAWVDDLLGKGLSVDPGKRFESMHALAREMERDPAAARRRAGWALAVVLALAASMAGTTAALRIRDARCRGGEQRLDGTWDERRRDAVRQAFTATGDPIAATAFTSAAEALDQYRARWGQMWNDACEAATVRGEQSQEVRQLRVACLDQARFRLDALVGLFAQADREVVRSAAKAARSLEAVDACADVPRLQSVTPVPSDPDTANRAQLLRRHLSEADARRAAGKMTEASELSAAAVAEARNLGHPGLLADALYLQGWVEHDRGQTKLAEDALEGAARASLTARDDVRLAMSWSLLASLVGYRMARPAEGRRWASMAEAVLPRLSLPTVPTAEVERARAVIDYADGHYADSLAHQQRALTLMRAALGPDTVQVVQMESNMGVMLWQMGRNAEAKEHHLKALAAGRRLQGPDHPGVATLLDNLGIVLVDLGDLQEAERAQREALDIRVRAYGENNPDVAKSLNNLGRTRNLSKRYLEARQVLDRALASSRASEGADHPMSGYVLDNMGGSSMGLHEPKRALEEFTRGYEILTKTEAGRADLALLLVGMASANLELQRPDQTLALLDRAEPAFQEDAPVQDRAQAKFLRARALRALHQSPDKQRALAEEARSLWEKAAPVYQDELPAVRAFLDSGRPHP